MTENEERLAELQRAGIVARDDASAAPAQMHTPDGCALLDDVAAWYRRFVIFAHPDAPSALALWALHTHAFDAARTTGYVVVSAPENESGKSRVLEVSRPIVARPWYVLEPSEAVVYRKIDRDKPTLLLDEYDAIFNKDREREGLRAVLNAGYRLGAEVPRCSGPAMDLRDFSTFCPKMLAGVGRLPKSIESRKIPIEMKRRRRDETVERFREGNAALQAEAQELHDRLAAWAVANMEGLKAATPDLPAALSDRRQDVWEPALAIADAVGGHWPETARRVAVALYQDAESVTSYGETLLAHIRETFDTSGGDRLSSAALLEALVERDDGPWATWWGRDVEDHRMRGPGARLAHLLKPYEIHSKTIRIGGETAKGYERSDFEDAWLRYLPPPDLALGDVTDDTKVTLQVNPTNDVTSVTYVTSPKGRPEEEAPQRDARDAHDDPKKVEDDARRAGPALRNAASLVDEAEDAPPGVPSVPSPKGRPDEKSPILELVDGDSTEGGFGDFATCSVQGCELSTYYYIDGRPICPRCKPERESAS